MSFRNYYFDSETGLYYLKARYYDSITGQFTQEDTVQDDNLQYNLYGYCSANPISYTDPSGHYKIENFNCYAYAFGYSDRWLIPGGKKKSYSGDLPYNYTVDYAADLVKSDFGDKVRKIKGKKATIKKGEYRIALRTSDIGYMKKGQYGPPYVKTEDFHFWKQNPKNNIWWDKPGATKIRKKGIVNPNEEKNWKRGKYLGEYSAYVGYMGEDYEFYTWNGKASEKKTRTLYLGTNGKYIYTRKYKYTLEKHYNSKTIYFAYKHKFQS